MYAGDVQLCIYNNAFSCTQFAVGWMQYSIYPELFACTDNTQISFSLLLQAATLPQNSLNMTKFSLITDKEVETEDGKRQAEQKILNQSLREKIM
jgi:hypothetical protein